MLIRGDHTSALTYCTRASLLCPHSSVAYGCMGKANQHLGHTSRAIDCFKLALQMHRREDPTTALYYYSHELGLTRSPFDLEFNLLTSYYSGRRFEECVSKAVEVLGLPHPGELRSGGALMLVLSFFDWSRSEDRLRVEALERSETAAGRLKLRKGSALIGEVSPRSPRAIVLLLR